MAQLITAPVDYSTRNDVDFAQFTDGQNWLLVRGEDYSVKTNTLVTAARRYAKEHGLIADAKRFNDDGQESVALRFRRQPTSGTSVAPSEQEAG